MRSIEKLELYTLQLLRGFPSLSETGKDTFAKMWPYFSLAIASLLLLQAYGMWYAMHYAEQLTYYISFTPLDRAVIYAGVVVSLTQAALFFSAYSPLLRREKRGWNLAFVGSLLSVVYATLQLFMAGYGIGSFAISVIICLGTLYLLSQIHECYLKKVSRTVPKSATITKRLKS